MKRNNFLLIIVMLLMANACRNPFFPSTGDPDEIMSLRSTPQGVITQLIDAYENRQLNLYKDLFPDDGSFKFFVAPSFLDEAETHYQRVSELRDTRLQEIGQSEYYYYWTQEKEVGSHSRLFSNASRIEFTEKPLLESIRKFSDDGDSAAELLLSGGRLEVEYYSAVDTIRILRTELDKQVFLLLKNSENLWVINKWYDFSGS